MNRAERLGAILDLLADAGQVDVDEVVAKLEVSPATARRDLDALAADQLLTRTRGGAISQSIAYDLPLRYRRDKQATQKNSIALAASALVKRGVVVGLCGGTTSTAIATVLGARADLSEVNSHSNLTVVTNAINIAAQLVMRPQIKTVVTGGVVHPHSYELVGPYSALVLGEISIDISFIGVNGIDASMGATVHDESEASINALMARRSTRAIVVADSSKIGTRAFATVGDLSLFSAFITDSGITDSQKASFTERGIEVIVA